MENKEYCYLTQKVNLRLNKAQQTFLEDMFYKARFIYNYGVNVFNETLKSSGKIFSGGEINLHFVKNKDGFTFLKDVSETLIKRVFENLSKAIIKKVHSDSEDKTLRFKDEKTLFSESFLLSSREFKVVEIPNKTHHYIEIDKNISPIKIKDKLRFKDCPIINGTFKKELDKYYCCILYKVSRENYIKKLNYPVLSNKNAIGIDVGLAQYLTTSSGLNLEANKPLEKKMRRLKRLYKQLDRKVHPRSADDPTPKSNNYIKLSKKIAKLHTRIANIRKDNVNKIASVLTRNFSAICMEDLSIKDMQKRKSFAKRAQDLSFYELKTKIKQKCALLSREFVEANKFFPSSKKCIKCSHINESLSMYDRVFRCENCGFEIDRDFNAACNLFKYMKNELRWGTSKLKPSEFHKLLSDCDKNKLKYYLQPLGSNQIENKKDVLVSHESQSTSYNYA